MIDEKSGAAELEQRMVAIRASVAETLAILAKRRVGHDGGFVARRDALLNSLGYRGWGR